MTTFIDTGQQADVIGVPSGGEPDQPDAWRGHALCAQTDPEAFFPEKGGTTQNAKLICLRCDVRDECLRYALENDERFGVWGGMSDRERRRIQRGETVEMKAPKGYRSNGHGKACKCARCTESSSS